MSAAAIDSIDGAASDGRSSSIAAEQGEGARSWWCCRPSLASVLLLTITMLLLSAGWVHQRKAQSHSRVPAFEQLHAWQVVSTRMRDQYQPCSPRPDPKQAACKLQGNVVATRRQLRDCGFQAVVVVPLAQVQSPQVRRQVGTMICHGMLDNVTGCTQANCLRRNAAEQHSL